MPRLTTQQGRRRNPGARQQRSTTASDGDYQDMGLEEDDNEDPIDTSYSRAAGVRVLEVLMR